jgi:hypothetical protein
MNQTDIYRKAIQRTFAELYSVPAESVDVVWNSEGVTVQCAGMIFTHQTGDDDHEFVSEGGDRVEVAPALIPDWAWVVSTIAQ